MQIKKVKTDDSHQLWPSWLVYKRPLFFPPKKWLKYLLGIYILFIAKNNYKSHQQSNHLFQRKKRGYLKIKTEFFFE